LPGDGRLVLFAAHPHAMAQGSEVGIAAAADCELRAGLNAGVALPAHVRLDVEGAAIGGINVHDVGRADIHAMSAAIAARHINEGRHDVSYLLSRRSMRRRSIMLGIFDAPLSEERSIRANTIGIEVVAFLTPGALMSYRPSILYLHSARSTNQIGLLFIGNDRVVILIVAQKPSLQSGFLPSPCRP